MLGIDRLIQPALEGFPTAYFAPTYKTLLEIWREVVRILVPITKSCNASDHRIELLTGGVIEFWQLDADPESCRGRKYRRVVIDEAAKARHLELAWRAAIRATLMDYSGDAWFLSTPRGQDYFASLFARGDKTTLGDSPDPYPDWMSWRMPTASNPHIPPSEIEEMRNDLGPRLFAQEVEALILTDREGALWTRSLIDLYRIDKAATLPEFKRIVVGLDPATTSNEDSCRTGIVVAALGRDGHGYVIKDKSRKASPSEWATTAIEEYKLYKADRIVGETNQGGDLIEHTLRTIDKNISYKGVHAKRGKLLRAEPIAALYEQGKIHHIGDDLYDLENEMCNWVQGEDSPDRLDALVHALTDLMIDGCQRREESASYARCEPENEILMLTQKEIDSYISADTSRRVKLSQTALRYEGHWTPSLKPSPADPGADDNLYNNLSALVVDTVAHYLFGNGVEIEVNGEDSPEDEWVEGFLEQQGSELFLLDLATSGGIHGDAYIRIHAPYDDLAYPDLEILDPEDLTIVPEPSNFRKIRAYIISTLQANYNASNFESNTTSTQTVIERNDAGTWTITVSVGDAFIAGRRKVVEQIEWPFAWCPIFHAKNLPAPHCAYGKADMGLDVQRMNASVNRELSNTSRITSIQAHQKFWAKGISDDTYIDMSPDTVTILEGDEAQLNVLPPNDTSTRLEYVEKLISEFHKIARLPEIAAGKLDNIGQLSGLALKILYKPLVMTVETKRLLYGAMLKEVILRAFEMSGMSTSSAVNLNWGPIIPTSELEEATTAAAKMQLGVSKTTLLTEMGYDPEIEAQKRALEVAPIEKLDTSETEP